MVLLWESKTTQTSWFKTDKTFGLMQWSTVTHVGAQQSSRMVCWEHLLGALHWHDRASLLARACPKALTRSGAARITRTTPDTGHLPGDRQGCGEMESDPGAGTGSWCAGTARAGGALRSGKHPKTFQLLSSGSISQKVRKRALPALAEIKALGTLTCQSENQTSRVTGN